MVLLAALGGLLSLLAVASPLHPSVRRLCHAPLSAATVAQLPLVAATQRYCSRGLDLAVLVSAATITLEVYLTLLPLLIWSGAEGLVVCGLLPQLALAGYVVFAIKDLLESPRPGDCLKLAPTAHIVIRDPSGDVEDGVPSAHCCGAVSLLFYCINAAAAAGALPVPKAAAQAAAVAWTAWLAWGRAYLGLHTPLDLATGSLLGWALIDLWALVEQLYTAWLHASLAPQTPAWQLPAQVLLCSFVLMRCYPMPRRWTSCYNYATAWQAGWAGTTVGWALRNAGGGAAAGSAATAAAGGWELSSITAAGVLKVLLGLGMIVLAKVTAKAVLLALLRRTFALVPLRIRCLWQPPVFGAVLRQAGKQQPQQLKGTAGAGEQQCSSSSGGAAAAKQQPAGKRQQPSSSGSIWGLRHSFDGTPNDVVATARWGSYFAVGIVISMWQAWYPALLQASGAFAASSSVS